MSKTLSDLPMDLHRLILSHDEEKLELKKENEKLKTRVKMLQCLLDEARQDNDSNEDDSENESDEYEDDEWDGECEECCRGKGDRPQINCVCERCNRIICRDCQALYDEDRYPNAGQNSHYVDMCEFCWETYNAVIDPNAGRRPRWPGTLSLVAPDPDQGPTAYEDGIDAIIDEHNKCRRHFCERREHLLIKTAFKQWVKKDE